MSVNEKEGRVVDLEAGRRAFLRSMGIMTAAAATATTALAGGSAAAQDARAQAQGAKMDNDILNFALNLEYLEAEYYLLGTTGRGLNDSEITGRGNPGRVIGGKRVNFAAGYLRDFFEEIAGDERAHVNFLRAALGDAKVARPVIDLQRSFTAAARAAGLIGPNDTFDAFADETTFLLGAFVFEDVGVTAYNGAAPAITNKDYLAAAAGIMAVEAYHAGEVRTNCYRAGLFAETKALSQLRDGADGSSRLDQPIKLGDRANIVPADRNALAYARTPDQVLGVVYLGGDGKGGFFPSGLYGNIK